MTFNIVCTDSKIKLCWGFCSTNKKKYDTASCCNCRVNEEGDEGESKNEDFENYKRTEDQCIKIQLMEKKFPSKGG